jgi:uncharacterized protein (UPF0276 family)
VLMSQKTTCAPGAGFGLGLRTQHYTDFIAAKQNVDWLEIITDNYLVDGGKPLVMLDTIRRDYPMAMHGVAMSIGAAAGVDDAYLLRVKQMADRIEPLWISDHLCWIGNDRQQLHDLYPLPYTDEAARHVIAQIQHVQDVLQRRLVLENVSSYINYKSSTASEWQFLSYIAQEADCLLLLDVNNVYVSSVNHRFDPMEYMHGLPRDRIQQIHLAGHSDNGDHIIDTHDHPVSKPVWDLYAKACEIFGPVAAMIERDAHIPALSILIAELDIARDVAARSAAQSSDANWHPVDALPAEHSASTAVDLFDTQQIIASYILSERDSSTVAATSLISVTPEVDPSTRLGIYHHAYRARLVEVLADTFAKTYLFMGSNTFDHDAMRYAVSHPPLMRSLNRYGAEFPAFLKAAYPANPELHELAQLDFDLRTRFDSADIDALNAEAVQQDIDAKWLAAPSPLHPSLVMRDTHTNVIQIWRAIDADEDVPPAAHHAEAAALIVWRNGLQPHFQSLPLTQAAFTRALASGHSINDACAVLADTADMPSQLELGNWIQQWLRDGLLRNDAMS